MSNPTSNFGWQMPTNSDLVTDLPADFEVFGQGVDTSLADLKGGTSGQILSKNSNTDMDFIWIEPNPGDITGITAGTGLTGGGTSGSVSVALDTTSAYVLPSQTGNSGKYLKTNGTAASWATVSAGVLQVQSTTSVSVISTSSSSYVDSGISVTITPSSTSSKILLSFNGGAGYFNPNSQSCGAYMTFYRNGSNIGSGTTNNGIASVYTEGAAGIIYPLNMDFMDSPSSTSALTYNVYFLATNTNRTAYLNGSGPAGRITLTAMEIQA